MKPRLFNIAVTLPERSYQPDLKVLLTGTYSSEFCDTRFRGRERIQSLPKPCDALTFRAVVSRSLHHEQPTP